MLKGKTMNIIIAKDYEQMSDRAFEIMRDVVVSRPNAVLGLATGSTPLGLYARMVRDHKEHGTSYKLVRTFNLDEYIGLDAAHPQSYAYFMRKNLFDSIDVDINNTNIENGKAADAQHECDRYNALLDAMPRDIQILGIGRNGHIAFNEPGTPFDSVTHVTELAESTVVANSRLFADIADVPRKAFTMGLKNIMDSKRILLLASGADKADAVYALVHGKITEAVPATILKNHRDVTVVCDEAAASKLDKQ